MTDTIITSQEVSDSYETLNYSNYNAVRREQVCKTETITAANTQPSTTHRHICRVRIRDLSRKLNVRAAYGYSPLNLHCRQVAFDDHLTQ